MWLTLVTPSLSCGGAERAVVLLAEGFLKKGHNVSVITLTGIETDFYRLPEGVHRLALNIAGKSPTLIHALWNNIYRLWVLRQAIRAIQPEVVISFLDQTNIVTLLSLLKTRYPVIVSEQNNPVISIGNLWNKLRRVTYPYAARVVSVSQGVDLYFDWLPRTKRRVIDNPLVPIKNSQSTISLPKGADPDKKWAVAMGRLTYQKGFDLLLPAFHKIADRHPDWQLLILGEGELRAKLEECRDDLGLTDQILFPGIISNPFPVLKSSKLFLLSSRWEGLPAVLFEAMACGLPTISTDCDSGPREIIRDNVDGILVPNEDVSALASAMEHLMSDEAERNRLAARAPEVAERFSLEKIIGIWEELIAQVVKKS